jgi:hypothetical protein
MDEDIELYNAGERYSVPPDRYYPVQDVFHLY